MIKDSEKDMSIKNMTNKSKLHNCDWSLTNYCQ